MPADYADISAWIDRQHDPMVAQVSDWAAINSGSHHLAGLQRQLDAIETACRPLGGECKRIDLPSQRTVDTKGQLIDQPTGQALVITQRPHAPHRVLLNIHYDTVYGVDHPFQAVERIDGNCLRGPGVADAKGGLVVMLTALAAFERSDLAANVGWQIVINPDEEIASPGSRKLLVDTAANADIGMVYEPALPHGGLIGARKGSGNFDLVVRGRSAHAGRDADRGRNAMHALADAIVAITALAEQCQSMTINVARIDGGGPFNVVPDLAIARFNLRVQTEDDVNFAENAMRAIVAELNQRDGYAAELHGLFAAPPKPMTTGLAQLLDHVVATGRALDMELDFQPSGGVCDGNRLAAAGLPTVDTLGVVGNHIHSEKEYIELDSLTQRAKLSALLLLKLAAGELDWPMKNTP